VGKISISRWFFYSLSVSWVFVGDGRVGRSAKTSRPRGLTAVSLARGVWRVCWVLFQFVDMWFLTAERKSQNLDVVISICVCFFIYTIGLAKLNSILFYTHWLSFKFLFRSSLSKRKSRPYRLSVAIWNKMSNREYYGSSTPGYTFQANGSEEPQYLTNADSSSSQVRQLKPGINSSILTLLLIFKGRAFGSCFKSPKFAI
jgi:hypothetical protein